MKDNGILRFESHDKKLMTVIELIDGNHFENHARLTILRSGVTGLRSQLYSFYLPCDIKNLEEKDFLTNFQWGWSEDDEPNTFFYQAYDFELSIKFGEGVK